MNFSGLNGESSFPGMASFDGTSRRMVLLKVSGEALAALLETKNGILIQRFLWSLEVNEMVDSISKARSKDEGNRFIEQYRLAYGLHESLST
ncbi:unnamed protein product [Microthlaspi erraticum]|uniref:Uncharacterized protein n=1 Tax=Microthlaspi erraticum TaxID=1685480 RepID=A0A6D2HSJ7_9BRAS|nr:unnamed protein product [Microthlaspi erraticum]